jgi:hypothetical protein
LPIIYFTLSSTSASEQYPGWYIPTLLIPSATAGVSSGMTGDMVKNAHQRIIVAHCVDAVANLL